MALNSPYTLRPLLKDVPLTSDEEAVEAVITCVDYWDNHLYVGTSAGEILHFVSLPSDPSDNSSDAQFILASRLEPSPKGSVNTAGSKGVQQLVLLPRVSKACILSNGILTFYTLPELSPAFQNTKLSNCSWIGGRDEDLSEEDGPGVEVIMICIKSRIRLVRIGEEPRLVKNIEYPGCLASARRSRYACVANAHSYALLDVENQAKIPLFPISSIDDNTAGGGEAENISSATGQISRNAPAAAKHGETGLAEPGSHGRSTSLGAFVQGIGRKQPPSRSRSRERTGLRSPARARSPIRSPSGGGSPTRLSQGHQQRPSIASVQARTSSYNIAGLKPHICTPITSEFLLTTGTTLDDPGVGIFVNCDGDVVRGTLEFSSYPSAVVVDGGDLSAANNIPSDANDPDGYVLAAVRHIKDGVTKAGIEVQRWDISTSEGRTWLELPDATSDILDEENNRRASRAVTGLGMAQTPVQLNFSEVGERLRSKRLQIYDRPATTEPSDGTLQRKQTNESERIRDRQEDDYTRQLGEIRSRVLVWSASSIYWIVKTPILLKLDFVIDQVLHASVEARLDQGKLIKVIRSIRKYEAKSETEFLSLGYIRQKIGIILFADLAANRHDVDPYINEKLFIEGNLDPRVILSMVPLLREDIVEGTEGIWIHAGLVNLLEQKLSATPATLEIDEVLSRPEEFDLLGLIKRYLMMWRQRKGFGSVADEAQVFSTVDAALLHVLLYQDQQALMGSGGPSSVRAELYAVADHGVECFDRAVDLLEEYRRLYVLSRLYQSRKQASKVLSTWRRIIEGETDEGRELTDGENEVRKYVAKVKDLALVEEYGTWLASRNPTIGVQIFTDDNSRVKLPPNQVVQLLQLKAPNAVKVYLEHVVFGKKNLHYANELISYYLDNVLKVLGSSEEARSILSQTYESYRALRPPKPTYRQFIIENAIDASWWDDRLRLLELLGGSHGAGFSYDVAKVLQRIEPFEEALVPESIILDGRQGRHKQALHLLTHGLGDYHTAVNYCLLGGASIFHPTSGDDSTDAVPSQEEQDMLFKWLLSEFLQIDDASDRVERTSELLERFGSFFDISYVLSEIPDSWSVELISGFLVSALRRLVHDKNEAMLCKALSGAENLRISAAFIEKCEELGPHILHQEVPS